MKLRKQFGALLTILLGATILSVSLCADDSESDSPEWKDEFAQICGQTTVATSLPSEDLHNLISDSEKLLEKLKDIEDPAAKIYIFRLEKCKALFEYSQDLREVQ